MNSPEIVGNNLSPKHSETESITNTNIIKTSTEHFNQNYSFKTQSTNEIINLPNNVAHKPTIQRQPHLSMNELSNEIVIQNSTDDNQQSNHAHESMNNITSPIKNPNTNNDEQSLMINESIDAEHKNAIANLNASLESLSTLTTQFETLNLAAEGRGSITSKSSGRKSCIVIRKFQKLDESVLSSTPAPDVKIGQRVAYKEYYGNEFGTIRWIGK